MTSIAEHTYITTDFCAVRDFVTVTSPMAYQVTPLTSDTASETMKTGNQRLANKVLPCSFQGIFLFLADKVPFPISTLFGVCKLGVMKH